MSSTLNVSPNSRNKMLPAVASRKLRPILFSTPMVQAILEGRKTQTRRLIKSRHESGLFQVCKRATDGQIMNIESLDWDERNCEKDITCPYGNIGDLLWVRESFMRYQPGRPFIYKTEVSEEQMKGGAFKFKPSIHMPYEACRLWLKITNIRIERLQEITPEDAEAEGIKGYPGDLWKRYTVNTDTATQFMGETVLSRTQSFKTLWQSINGEESWDSNPFVWVVEFERCSKP